LVARSFEQRERKLLILKRLAVLERHVEEETASPANLDIIAMGDSAAGNVAGEGIGGKGRGALPEHIAGQLIEQQDRGQRFVRAFEEVFGRQSPLFFPSLHETRFAESIQ